MAKRTEASVTAVESLVFPWIRRCRKGIARQPGLQRREWAAALAPAYFPASSLTLGIYFRTAKNTYFERCREMGEESRRPVHSLEDVNYKMKLGNMARILNSFLGDS